MQSATTCAPSGSSETSAVEGPTNARWASTRPTTPRSEPLHHPFHVLQAVPTRHLDHEPVHCAEHRAFGSEDRCAPSDMPHASVAPSELVAVAVATICRDDPDPRHDVDDLVLAELLVLRGERVDRWRDHPDLVAVDPGRHVLAQGKHVRGADSEVGTQELPGLVGVGVARLSSHVTSPNHDCTGLRERRREAGSLRIVQQDHVTSLDSTQHARQVGGRHRFVVTRLGGTESAVITFRTVQAVVHPLGYREEICVTTDHQPPDVHFGVERVTDEHLQHLGHSASCPRWSSRSRGSCPGGCPWRSTQHYEAPCSAAPRRAARAATAPARVPRSLGPQTRSSGVRSETRARSFQFAAPTCQERVTARSGRWLNGET